MWKRFPVHSPVATYLSLLTWDRIFAHSTIYVKQMYSLHIGNMRYTETKIHHELAGLKAQEIYLGWTQSLGVPQSYIRWRIPENQPTHSRSHILGSQYSLATVWRNSSLEGAGAEPNPSSFPLSECCIPSVFYSSWKLQQFLPRTVKYAPNLVTQNQPLLKICVNQKIPELNYACFTFIFIVHF